MPTCSCSSLRSALPSPGVAADGVEGMRIIFNMATVSLQISTVQYGRLIGTLFIVLGILAVIIVFAYPVFEKWRFSKLENRMLEQKNKHNVKEDQNSM